MGSNYIKPKVLTLPSLISCSENDDYDGVDIIFTEAS